MNWWLNPPRASATLVNCDVCTETRDAAVWQKIQTYLLLYHQTTVQLLSSGCGSSSLHATMHSLLFWLDYYSCLSLHSCLCVCSFGNYKINAVVQPWWQWNKSPIVNPPASCSGVARGDRRGQHHTQSCNVDPPTTKKQLKSNMASWLELHARTVFSIRFRPLCQKELSDLWTLWRKSPWPWSHISVLQQWERINPTRCSHRLTQSWL